MKISIKKDELNSKLYIQMFVHVLYVWFCYKCKLIKSILISFKIYIYRYVIRGKSNWIIFFLKRKRKKKQEKNKHQKSYQFEWNFVNLVS